MEITTWFFMAFTIVAAVMVIMSTHPIHAAIALSATMVGVAGLMATLDAYFLAVVQVAVYAGAVLVLFLMVLMLFDLKRDTRAFSRGSLSMLTKISIAGIFGGLIAGAALLSAHSVFLNGNKNPQDTTNLLSQLIFSKYVFIFEGVGLLLLIIAIGVVVLARSKGGTHA